MFYIIWVIIYKINLTKTSTFAEKFNGTLHISYVPAISENIEKVLSKENKKTIFLPKLISFHFTNRKR